MFNKVFLMGNLTGDPVVRDITNGDKTTQVANFRIGVSGRKFKRRDGTEGQETLFIDCEAWDSGATSISKLFVKGDPILIEGTLRNDEWEQDGVKRNKIKTRVSNFTKLNKRVYTEEEKAAYANSSTSKAPEAPTEPVAVSVGDDDIPF